MNKLKLKRTWLYMAISILIFQSISFGQDWDDYPPLEVYGLYQEHNQDWFHISQSCDFWYDAFDEDSDECGEPDGGDHIDPDECWWYFDDAYVGSGVSTTWSAAHFTASSVEVYCWVGDDQSYPDGSNTQDDLTNTFTPSAYVDAWEVMATMTVEGIPQVINESGYGGYDTSVVVLGNLNDSVSVSTGPYATDDGPEDCGVQINATWEVDPVPSGASTYTATGSAVVSTAMSGELKATANDDVLFGSGSLSIGVSVGIPPFGVSISFDPDMDEGSCGSIAGIGFGFDSDVLDSCGGSNQYAIDIESDDSDIVPFGHSDLAFASGSMANGVTKGAEISIEGYVDAHGNIVPAPPYGLIYQNSSAEVSSSGSYAFGVASCSASNLYLDRGWKYIN